MRILISGAAGMIGRKLTDSLATHHLSDRRVSSFLLTDIFEPPAPKEFKGKVIYHTGDFSNPEALDTLLTHEPEVIFHLAAIVSGAAEMNFAEGYRVNLAGTQALFEAIRIRHEKNGYHPRVVFASSNAVFGGAFPDTIPDDFHLTPQTSYGIQKAICELLLQDYSRKGFFDGVGIRLPTISVRPGKPNAAASGFFSGIIREPLAGLEAVLPVPDTTRHWMTSPRSAIGFLRHAATLDTQLLKGDPNLSMPAISLTVAEQIEALGRVAGSRAVSLITRRPDPVIEKIVSGWARDFAPERALALGFVSETSYDDVIRAHIEDELGGRINL